MQYFSGYYSITSGSRSVFADTEKNITVLPTLRCKNEFVNQLEILTIEADSSSVLK